jgi:uncharacterized membrane protein
MTGMAMVFAFAVVSLDESATVSRWMVEQNWAYTGSADGASRVLSTIAGSMITIAGVVFSMTLVALSLASSQLGPRLLRNFMRDTRNQVVLGTFIATFVYCLLVLRTIRRAEQVEFVPHLSVTIAVLLAIASLAVLIYFIHHVSVSIQADEVVARVNGELNDGIDRLFPEDMERGESGSANASPGAALPVTFDLEARPVGSADDGYLQSIDLDSLLELAKDENALFRLERRPGQYVFLGCPLVSVWPADRITEPLEERINSAFILGHQRTASQDIQFPIHQLVEIAVRALSPGINDPFTANTCIDRLGSALHCLAQREMPSPFRLDEQDRLRVVVPALTFPEIVDASIDPIRQYARSSALVTIHLLKTIAVVAGATHRPADRAALLRQADMIVRSAREALPEDGDRQAAEACYRDASRALS